MYTRIHGTIIRVTPEFQELLTQYRENPEAFKEVIYGQMNLEPYVSDDSDDDD